jgi:hypothetical protein
MKTKNKHDHDMEASDMNKASSKINEVISEEVAKGYHVGPVLGYARTRTEIAGIERVMQV